MLDFATHSLPHRVCVGEPLGGIEPDEPAVRLQAAVLPGTLPTFFETFKLKNFQKNQKKIIIITT